MALSRLLTISLSSQTLLSRTMWSALATLLLTSVHHIYGAYVYATPWRLHAAYVSAFAAVAIAGSRLVLLHRSGDVTRKIAFAVFALVTITVAVLLIGLFEGAYNHVLKNALYFAGASPDRMGQLFPAPTYEMPNDVFFEITGILQVVPAAFTALFLYRLCVSNEPQEGKLRAGDVIRPRALTSIRGAMIGLPQPDRLVHLQFRRFAGCPVCNFHLRSFVRRHDEISAAGIREIIVFHSTAEELVQYEGDLPFQVIADPGKRLYAAFGVEASPRALLDPRVWLPIVRGVLFGLADVIGRRRPMPHIRPTGGSLGLPADLLIGSDGRVIASKYGVHADDHWSVDELLQLALTERRTAPLREARRQARLASEAK